MNNSTLEGICYSAFVKYDRLSRITYETFSNTSIADATSLNIFIDLYSIIHSIFSEHSRTVINDYTAITSILVNMCGHYREFFNRLSVRTKFYIISSYNVCDINKKFVADYNETFNKKISLSENFSKVAENNFELLDLLCPYLPDIFFVRSLRNFESSVIISHIIDILNDPSPNLIISKDIYPLQLCASHPYTAYLRPQKSYDGDFSLMVPINEKSSFRYEFWNMAFRTRHVSNIDNLVSISPLNFSLFMALNKFPERNMNTVITNLRDACKIIYNMSAGEDIKILPEQLYSDQDVVSRLPIAKIEARYHALDVSYMKPYYKLDPESSGLKFVNLRDDAVVNHINSKFFQNNPIDLSRL